MTSQGGDIGELLRRLGTDALVHEAESHGLSPRAGRLKCPFEGCAHKGAERERTAVAFIGDGNHPRIHCYACKETGDFIDLLQRTRGCTKEEAIARIRGAPVPDRAPPTLRVVGSTPPDEEGKLKPSEVQRLWDALATDSQVGRDYLERRGLGDAVDEKLVRFANDDVREKELASHARRGFRIAALLSDVLGQPRGIQLRLVREPKAKEPKIISAKGSVTSRAFFGRPDKVAAAPLVCITEGLADTLAVQLWAGDDAVVVGAAGKNFLRRIAEELESAGIDVEGKLFALFVQNDTPTPLSKREFNGLKQLLQARGARTVFIEMPAEFKDIAEFRAAKPESEWPPAKLVEAFGDEPGDDQEKRTVIPDGHGLPTRKQYTTNQYSQNFTTLLSLIDDPSSREALLLTREELTFDRMTKAMLVGGRELVTEDFTKVRTELEGYARSSDNKPLQFKETDIEKAMKQIAQRRQVHPLQDWVAGLKWDGKERLETELPRLFGHEEYGFDGRLLRRWFVSAVARAMEPGCKVDTVLILKGGGGAGKTKFFETVGGRWYTGGTVVPGDKDGMMILRRFWIVEWGELDAMNRSRSVETTKHFLSLRRDDFRDPYGNTVRSAERHCVIVGTTNKQEFLVENEGGNRRFWPVEVRCENINIRWVEENREQLFAEALAIFKAGTGCPACAADADRRCGEHRWWLTKDEAHILATRHQEYETDPHPWFHPISSWLDWPVNESRTFIATEQVMVEVLKLEIEKHKRSDQMEVAKIMKKLGWTKDREFGARGRAGWRRPGSLL